MFYSIKGIITYKNESFIVVENQGIGYKIFSARRTMEESTIGNEVCLYTYMYIREDACDIFGFLTIDELQFFQDLIAVSGVGPKAAVAMLSTFTPQELITAVITGDAKQLAKAPGIGIKTAQRIILDLKDKMKNEEIKDAVIKSNTTYVSSSEAVDALLALGYNESEARRAVSAVGSGFSLEDTIKKALMLLAG